MKPPKVQALNPRLSPRLDAYLGGSDQVNECRARQSPSVRMPRKSSDTSPMRSSEPDRSGSTDMALTSPPLVAPDAGRQATPPVRTISRGRVAALTAERPEARQPAELAEFSLFVRLDRDLDQVKRANAMKEVARLASRVRWKLDTAAVEMSAGEIPKLLAHPAVAYVEPGQPLRTPEPSVGRNGSKPPGTARRQKTQSRLHHDGKDVLVGIIDVGGFDFAHKDFLTSAGKTRWVAIWDQAGTSRPSPDESPFRSEGLNYGSEIREEHMNAAIAAAADRAMAATSLEPQSQMQVASHGTHVASIAAGNSGVARRAHLAGVLVSLRPEDQAAVSSFYDSTRIADAVEYLLDLAEHLGDGTKPLPLSINISLGTNGHAHDTSSAMARWIDNALATRGRCISVAAGNAGQVEPSSPSDRGYITGRVHAGGTIPATNLRHELGWIVGGDGVSDLSENEVEIWYGSQDRFTIEVRPPGGPWIGPVALGQMIRNEVLSSGTVLNVHSEGYHPANGLNRISIILSPFFGRPAADGTQQIGPVASGEWRLRLTGAVVRNGRFDAWIERDDPRRMPGSGQQWRYPSYFAPGSYTDDRMIGSLACAERLLSVANVDIARGLAHATSSRGPTRDGRPKPDIAADGTNVVAARGFDRDSPWIEMTGTSMASPFVCGVAALMLNIHSDLTSAQIQGIMRSTSAPLAGQTFGWRTDTGFGLIDAAACLQETATFVAMLKSAQ